MTTPLRRAVEQRSAAPLAWLATRPRWIPFVLVLALLVGGLFAPPAVGVVLLAVLLLLLGWLSYLSWPRLAGGGRVVRLAVLALVVVAAVQRATET
ncbi:MAG: DUF6703 family protein [Mycobacteriales bacterium]